MYTCAKYSAVHDSVCTSGGSSHVLNLEGVASMSYTIFVNKPPERMCIRHNMQLDLRKTRLTGTEAIYWHTYWKERIKKYIYYRDLTGIGSRLRNVPIVHWQGQGVTYNCTHSAGDNRRSHLVRWLYIFIIFTSWLTHLDLRLVNCQYVQRLSGVNNLVGFYVTSNTEMPGPLCVNVTFLLLQMKVWKQTVTPFSSGKSLLDVISAIDRQFFPNIYFILSFLLTLFCGFLFFWTLLQCTA